jgi:ATP-dependent Clp protease ATP-binding subunit ClpA
MLLRARLLLGFLCYFPIILSTFNEFVAAFSPCLPTTTRATIANRRSSSTATSHNVVFTRLSEDCLQALGVAQEQAKLSEQKQIDASYMLLGLIEHPGNTESTLQKYNIQWQTVRRTLNYLRDTPGGKIKTLTLSDFKDTQQNVQLPYSHYLQERLFEAGRISQQMGSAEIHTEHVFLALLHYQEINGETLAATRGDDCEAMELLYHIDATLEGEDVCQDLLLALMDAKKKQTSNKSNNNENENENKNNKPTTTSTASNNKRSKDSVLAPTSGGASLTDSTKTNLTLLEQYGTDLTQMAKDGELDIVHGREEEIQSCLRILLRRRKNNVCLIGEGT